MNVCLLFEQSGTFKKCFQLTGDFAIDVDIANKYGETDLQIDIFDCLEHNLLNFINFYDLIIAFFPCTWFSKQNDLIYRRQLPCFKKWENERVDRYIENRLFEYDRARNVLVELIRICKKPLIIENPRGKRIKEILGNPQCFITDRSKYGDILSKPTYFYTYNGAYIEPLDIIPTKRGKDVNHISRLKRSEISSIFADNFIKHIKIKPNDY